jgi:hypothetical protein
MMGFVEAIAGALFGGGSGIDWEAKARSDEQRARRQKRDHAYANGWMEWIPDYMNTFPQTPRPQNHARVWIWRLDWEFPSVVDPSRLDPAMNVNGLLWKPWRPSDQQALDKPT